MGVFHIFKNKFVILITILFLLLTNVSAYAQFSLHQKNDEYNITVLDENVPNWDVGYSWTYKGEIKISENLNLYLDIKEASLVVIKKDNEVYSLRLGGDITGSLDVPDTPFSFEIQKVSGNMLFTESNLGLKEVELIFSGKIVIESIKYSAEATFKLVYSQTRDFISFPLYVGKSWVIPKCDISVNIKIKMLGIPFYSYNFIQPAPEINGSCLSYDEVTLGGITYEVYKIFNGGSSNLSYVPSIGNMLIIESEEEPIIELISSNFPSPNNPLKPDKPIGPIKGKNNVEYSYQTKTIDPNQDKIKYGWDWDGDMIADEWTEYYNSNETISINHKWTQKGMYIVGVKARDLYGHESQWSDSLSINIPRNNNYSKLNINLLIRDFIHFFKLKFNIN